MLKRVVCGILALIISGTWIVALTTQTFIENASAAPPPLLIVLALIVVLSTIVGILGGGAFILTMMKFKGSDWRSFLMVYGPALALSILLVSLDTLTDAPHTMIDILWSVLLGMLPMSVLAWLTIVALLPNRFAPWPMAREQRITADV